MAKVTYVAILEASPEGIGVTFPELPGCVSWSPDGSEVIQQAEEALSLHLEGLAEEGMEIPAPRNFGDVVAEAFKDAGREVVYALVTVEGPDASERVNIYLAKSLLERIDAYCRDEAINRSAFFVHAARSQLNAMRTVKGMGGARDQIAAGLVHALGGVILENNQVIASCEGSIPLSGLQKKAHQE